ncbi:MAG: hypothetical protein ACRD1L_14370, partial [Terriglobales bacterium]
IAVAQRHLEAWFFADAASLRSHLGDRSLGSIGDQPDAMENPKSKLVSLVAPYTARRAGEIAAALDPAVIRGRSPSFAAFIAALRNGGAG